GGTVVVPVPVSLPFEQPPETLLSASAPVLSDGAGQPKQSLAKRIVAGVFAAYMGGVSLSFAYFTLQFIKEHSFLDWLLLGEFVPAGKALIWPYYAASPLFEKGWTQEEKENLAHVKRGAIATGKAMILLEGFGIERIRNGKVVQATDAARVTELLK